MTYPIKINCVYTHMEHKPNEIGRKTSHLIGRLRMPNLERTLKYLKLTLLGRIFVFANSHSKNT